MKSLTEIMYEKGRRSPLKSSHPMTDEGMAKLPGRFLDHLYEV